jgi:DNA-binding CsgD family transcriptional regulator
MTKKQKAIIDLFADGKTTQEVCKALKISAQNLYMSCWRMRQKGIDPKRQARKLPITERQKTILYLLMGRYRTEQIANLLKIDWRTVENHASQAFKRLGLTVPGVDRIAALKDHLPPLTVTTDDPFFG